MQISFAAKSTSTAFNLSVSTGSSAASEGTDDLDILLNVLWTSWTMYLDPDTLWGAGLTPAQWRTVFGYLNLKDFDGNFLNATQLPASGGSAKTYYVIVPIPLALENLFPDGGHFKQGSHRVKSGELDFQNGASLSPASTALANGSINVTTAASILVQSQHGEGTAGDVGPTWGVKRIGGLPTVFDFNDGRMRLLLADQTAAASSAVTNWNIGQDVINWNPQALQGKYQADQLLYSGFDVTARCTPLTWMERSNKFLDWLGKVGKPIKYDAVSGVSTVSVYDVFVQELRGTTTESVATKVGSGGPTSVINVTPKSLPPGTAIPTALMGLIGQRIAPGKLPPVAGAIHNAPTPAHAAQHVIAKNQTARTKIGFFNLFGRR